ncbi:hypothetical protein FRB90_004836, partial [Tulasnella sp. 427]
LFKKGEIVGKGAFGSVHRGIHIGTGAVVALKIINLDIADDDVEAIQKEVALLSQLRGGEASNITEYYGSWLEGPRVWIVMDFASGGSVRTLMKATKTGAIEERHVVVIVRELLVALSFLHKSGVIHRDIKAANVLITAECRVILCDFGVSALLATQHSKRATTVGTPYWMAPEVISETSFHDTKADIWSLGVTIYEMMMKLPPHADQVPMKAFMLIKEGPPPQLPEKVGSKDLKDFLAMCLKEEPKDRLTADELAKSKFIKATTRTPLLVLRELLSAYDGWVKQGNVRESIVPNGIDELREMDDDEDAVNWEFDTIRQHHDGTTPAEPPPISTANGTVPSTNFQAPRSLRMLFEDSSNPPQLSESFLRNNMGGSRQHHGQASRSPSPFKEAKSPPTPPSVTKSRGIRIPLDINIPLPGAHIPSPLPSAMATPPADVNAGMPSISVDRQEEPLRPGSRARKGASPMNFQFPRSATPARDREPAGSSAAIPTRPRTPSSKDPPIRLGREPQEGLTPPKALNFHHPASRSMDSPRLATHATPSTGLGKSIGSHALGRSQTAGVFGSQSDSEAFGSHVDGTRLAPARPLVLKRQASVETGLSLGRNGGLRDGLHLGVFVPHLPSIGGGELPPPSPSGGISPLTRAFGSFSQGHMDSPQTDGSGANTSSNSTASASTSISSATSISTGYGPPIQPFNYAALLTGDDVQTELARVVEDLKTWLTVVETGLNGVLEATNIPLPALRDGLVMEDEVEGDSWVADESYDLEGHEYEESIMQEELPTA